MVRNVNLNPGGFIGAAIGAVTGAAIGFLIFGVHKEAICGGSIKGLVILAVAGNVAWELLFRKRPEAGSELQLQRELQGIIDELGAYNMNGPVTWNDHWEDWARRGSEVAARCEAAGYPAGAEDLRWVIRNARNSAGHI